MAKIGQNLKHIQQINQQKCFYSRRVLVIALQLIHQVTPHSICSKEL